MKTIVVVGVSLSLIDPNLSFFEQKMKNGCKLRFLLLDPTSPSVPIWDSTTRIPTVKQDIERTLNSSLSIVKRIGTKDKGKCEVRLSNTFQSFSIVAFDPSKSTGWMIVEYHAYKATLGDRPHILLTQEADAKWFEFYKNQYERIWAESTNWTPPENES